MYPGLPPSLEFKGLAAEGFRRSLLRVSYEWRDAVELVSSLAVLQKYLYIVIIESTSSKPPRLGPRVCATTTSTCARLPPAPLPGPS